MASDLLRGEGAVRQDDAADCDMDQVLPRSLPLVGIRVTRPDGWLRHSQERRRRAYPIDQGAAWPSSADLDHVHREVHNDVFALSLANIDGPRPDVALDVGGPLEQVVSVASELKPVGQGGLPEETSAALAEAQLRVAVAYIAYQESDFDILDPTGRVVQIMTLARTRESPAGRTEYLVERSTPLNPGGVEIEAALPSGGDGDVEAEALDGR